MKKCYICEKGNLEKKKAPFNLYGIEIGKFDVEVCSKCREKFFDEKSSNLIDEVAKSKDLWGLEAKTKVSKAGDNLIVRVNKRLASFYELKQGEEVILYPKNKKELVVNI